MGILASGLARPQYWETLPTTAGRGEMMLRSSSMPAVLHCINETDHAQGSPPQMSLSAPVPRRQVRLAGLDYVIGRYCTFSSSYTSLPTTSYYCSRCSNRTRFTSKPSLSCLCFRPLLRHPSLLLQQTSHWSACSSGEVTLCRTVT